MCRANRPSNSAVIASVDGSEKECRSGGSNVSFRQLDESPVDVGVACLKRADLERGVQW